MGSSPTDDKAARSAVVAKGLAAARRCVHAYKKARDRAVPVDALAFPALSTVGLEPTRSCLQWILSPPPLTTRAN